MSPSSTVLLAFGVVFGVCQCGGSHSPPGGEAGAAAGEAGAPGTSGAPGGGASGMAGSGAGDSGSSGAASGAAGAAAGAAGALGTAGAGTGGPADQTLCGAVSILEPRTVEAGQTLAVCAGSRITLGSGVTFTVAGTLLVQGDASNPVAFAGSQASAGAWAGIVLGATGVLEASYLEIHDATLALRADAGSSYQVDHLLIDDSTSLLQLRSSGSIAHGVLHGLGSAQSTTPVSIIAASPTLSDTLVDQGLFGGIDQIVVSGAASAPVFDHMEVADSHCAFHFNQATGAVIRNSFVHHNVYGLMVTTSTEGQLVHNNFEDDEVGVGSCVLGGSAELVDNYFGMTPLDVTCAALPVSGSVPTPYASDVGPRP